MPPPLRPLDEGGAGCGDCTPAFPPATGEALTEAAAPPPRPGEELGVAAMTPPPPGDQADSETVALVVVVAVGEMAAARDAVGEAALGEAAAGAEGEAALGEAAAGAEGEAPREAEGEAPREGENV